jgi:tetratricopeptide (TPR) repeat protein
LNPILLFKIFDMKNIWKIAHSGIVLLCVVAISACVTTKKKGQETGGKKTYHSFTNKYNYWFNADELFNLTITKLEEGYKDDYNQILEIYPYSAADPNGVRAELDNVILKAAKGISLHRPGTWTDDNYGLMGKAQFLKRDYETAEATYKFIREEQDPRRSSTSKIKGKSSKQKLAENKKKAAAKKKKEAARKKKAAAARKKKAKAHNKKGSKKTSGKETTKSSEKPAPIILPKDVVKPKENSPYSEPWGHINNFPSAMVWYGRTLTERDKYDEAEFLFRELWEESNFPLKNLDELATAEAYLFIKQKKYDKAIAPLVKAIELTNNKKLRARLSFILAQLYERAGQHEAAYAAYDKVLNSTPKYEMEFNARLQQTSAAWANGKTDSESGLQTLERMLKDEKNLDYRDQIYFSMANIELHDKKNKEGIEYLRKSLSYSKNNTVLRAESYLKLADLYFEEEQFVLAKAYYDSTLTVLPVEDVRHKRAADYATNLKDIARLIQTIQDNDSIVRIFRMTDVERKDLAKKIKKQRQTAENEALKNSAANTGPADPAKAPAPIAGNKPSAFYFYNETFLKKGRKDFARQWGDRKLDDNWRRSARVGANVADNANPQRRIGDGEQNAEDSTQIEADAEAALKDIFSNIPKSEEELTVIHMATYEAMYQLGTLFRDRLQNNRRCSGTLEEMQTRYPDTARYEKETWYYCYLAFTDLTNREQAQYYYDKLVEKYPKSAYARTLTDPNFLNATKEREQELNKYYEVTYVLFKKGSYKEAFDWCESAPKKFGSQNPLVAKFALLSALCTGSIGGNEAYCAALGEVIKRYPDSPEAIRAKEIARLLSCKGFEVEEKKKSDTPLDEGFTREDDKLHYFIVALTGENVRLDDVKAAVSDYNSENHKTEQLRISNIFLGTDTNTPIIVIRKFDNKEQALRYYKEVKSQPGFLGETAKKTYNKEIFVVTQENYRRILKNKTLDRYRKFFEENYLKK